MGRKCFVPYCKSGYSSCRDSVTMFSCPNDPEFVNKWSEAVARQDRPLRPTDCICEKHFKEEDIVRYWKALDRNGKEVMKVAYKRIRLRDGAIPCYFPSSNNSYSRKRRKVVAERDAKIKRILTKTSERYSSNMIVSPQATSDFPGDEKNHSNNSDGNEPNVEGFEVLYDSCDDSEEHNNQERRVVNELKFVDQLARARLFEDLWKDSQLVSLPSKSWAVFQLEANQERKIVITQMGLMDSGAPVPVKQVCLDEEMNVELYLKSNKLHCEEMNINLPQLYTVPDVSTFIQSVDGLLDWE